MITLGSVTSGGTSTNSQRTDHRAVLAAGAVDAAVWLVGREAGWDDVAAVVED